MACKAKSPNAMMMNIRGGMTVVATGLMGEEEDGF